MNFNFLKGFFNSDLIKATSIAGSSGEFYGKPLINENLVLQVERQVGIELSGTIKKKIDDLIVHYNKKEYSKSKNILKSLSQTKIKSKQVDLVSKSSTLKEIKGKLDKLMNG